MKIKERQKELQRLLPTISNFLAVSHDKNFSFVFCTTGDVDKSSSIMIFAKNQLDNFGFDLLESDKIADEKAEKWLQENKILYFTVTFQEK